MYVSFEKSIVINLKMTISELILTLPPDTKSLIRSTEKTNRKIINTQLSLVFNKTCIQENLLPACIYIYIHTHTHTHRHTHPPPHTHTHIYIYIYFIKINTIFRLNNAFVNFLYFPNIIFKSVTIKGK